MKNVVTLFCLLVTFVASAQFSGAGYYRVRNVSTDAYICINGTHFEKSTNADAFWPCIKMKTDSDHVSDPGSVIYIDHIGDSCDLCSQGVSTYGLTHLMMTVDFAEVNEGGRDTYVAKTYYEYVVDGELVAIDCIFCDRGLGLQAGSRERTYSRWWIEPVNEASIETSYFGVKPINEEMVDAEGWYWTSLCCDFPVMIPEDGGVYGAYTVTEVERGEDNFYYAEPVLMYEQGDIIPAATPVLIKCKYPYASGNKLIPVGRIVDNTTFPIVNDMLMGNYFSPFINHNSLQDPNSMGEYIPKQATKASEVNLALGIDENGKLGFFPQEEGTYMAANTAWLSIASLDETKDRIVVYLAPELPDVPEIVYGDSDNDGVVSINDVSFLIDYILSAIGSDEAGPGADADGSGVVDISDISYLIDMILTKN